ncbi:uncharacterized protein LOC119981063 isoform X2 [Tripterygium wilfordii]|uniref:uncharacterized protein LOC119981063 isoform X2 n=1 Tax=Tripterygium wilfordii TaxID=458696 RepID=UPI0018F839F0|nr:uncharacterized protein LOC119981063 isoform X2 [Tripterygium wilfordii]
MGRPFFEVELSATELESLQSEIADLEEREAHLKAQFKSTGYECSSISKIQVDSWLLALQSECKSGSDTKVANGSCDM